MPFQIFIYFGADLILAVFPYSYIVNADYEKENNVSSRDQVSLLRTRFDVARSGKVARDPASRFCHCKNIAPAPQSTKPARAGLCVFCGPYGTEVRTFYPLLRIVVKS